MFYSVGIFRTSSLGSQVALRELLQGGEGRGKPGYIEVLQAISQFIWDSVVLQCFWCVGLSRKLIHTELSRLLPLLLSPSWPIWIIGKADAALNYYFCQKQTKSYHHIIHINTRADQLEDHLGPQITSGSWIIFRVDCFCMCVKYTAF